MSAVIGRPQAIAAFLLLFQIAWHGQVAGDNCDWQKIGKFGASIIINEIPLLGSMMNNLLSNWPDDCAHDGIRAFINTILDKRRQENMKEKFDDFRGVLETAREYNWTLNHEAMIAFKMDVEGSESVFMAGDHQEDSVIYFR